MFDAMEDDEQTYILPVPAVARWILAGAGLFALVITPWELWRGVWPLNATTPFFGFLIAGGMSIGAMTLYAGLVAPSAVLRFAPGSITVERRYLWGMSRQILRQEDLSGLEIEERDNSEGPNDWYVVIRRRNAGPLTSRPLGTKDAAEKLADTFREKLGLPDSASV
jgi:hypothetical protein